MSESETASNPFARRLAFLPLGKKPRKRGPSTISAIEMEGSLLRVVIAQGAQSNATVQRVASHKLELPPDSDRSDVQVMGAALAKAIAQLGLKPGPVVMGIPRNQVVLRTLTLPVLKDIRELASMVHFQVGRDLPFRMEDAVVDFKIRRRLTPTPAPHSAPGKPDSTGDTAQILPPKLEVLVACVKREVVEYYQQLASAADLKLLALGLLPYANVRCLEACHTELGDDVAALVSLRPDEINIEVIAEEALLFSRGTTIRPLVDPAATSSGDVTSGAPLPEARMSEGFADAATIEVVRTLHAYGGMDPANPVRQVIVTGATGLEPKVVDSLSHRFTAVCRVLDVADSLKLPADSKPYAAGAMGAIGLALGILDDHGLPFNFLNPKQPAVQRDLRRIRILSGIAAVAAVFVFVLAIRSHLINKRNEILRSVQAELADAKTKQPIYRKMIQQATTVEDWIHGEHNWLEHAAFLSAILPPSDEVYLTSISVGSQNIIRLAVQARSGETLAKLEKQLRNAGYNVKPIAITPGADRYGYEFRSNVELVVPDKMKIDLSKVRPPARPADDASLDPGIVRRGGGPG